jgi:hypothetical protein
MLGEGSHLGIVTVQPDQVVVQPTSLLRVGLLACSILAARPVGLRFAAHHGFTVTVMR